VQRLVDRAAGRVEVVGQLCRRDPVDGGGDEDRPLAWRELACHADGEEPELLAGLDPIGQRGALVGGKQDAVRIARDAGDATAHAAPDAHRRLQGRKAARPRQELAVAAEVVELPQERHERVVCGLHGKIVDVAPRKVRPLPDAPPDVERRLAT
jgi:hypothetical protein